MPIELSWLIPNKILLSRWSGDVSADDMRLLVEELGIILPDSSAPIHTLIDLSDAHSVAPDVVAVYAGSPVALHPNRGRIAIAGEVPGMVELGRRLNESAQRELVHLCATRAEARDFLLRNDTPPPPLVSTSLPDHTAPSGREAPLPCPDD